MKKLIYIFLICPLLCHGQYIKQASATGSKIIRYPNLTITNTLANVGIEKSALPTPDTIYAATMAVGSRYAFSAQINITTPALSMGNLTIKIKSGPALASVLNLTTGISLTAGVTNVPVYIEGEMEITSNTTQIINARVRQMNGTVLNVNTGNMVPQADWSLNMANQNLFDVTLTFTGVTLGTTSYTTRIFRRIIE